MYLNLANFFYKFSKLIKVEIVKVRQTSEKIVENHIKLNDVYAKNV